MKEGAGMGGRPKFEGLFRVCRGRTRGGGGWKRPHLPKAGRCAALSEWELMLANSPRPWF